MVCSGLFINIGSTTKKSTAPFCYNLSIPTVFPKYSHRLFCEFLLDTFFCIKKTYDGSIFTSGGIFSWRYLSFKAFATLNCINILTRHHLMSDYEGKVKGLRLQFVLPIRSTFFLYRLFCIFIFQKALAC